MQNSRRYTWELLAAAERSITPLDVL